MAAGRQGRLIQVGPVTVARTGSAHRVAADVDGFSVWFETQDLEMSPAPEAFGSAFLIPALHGRAGMSVVGPVDPTWAAHVEQVPAILRDWWGYPKRALQTRLADGDGASVAPDQHATGSPTALFFSGGVDSFHQLLRGAARPDWLVTLQGFDFALDDHPRAAAVEASVRQITSDLGMRAVFVRTNVREHPLVRATPWERAHGGVLGGVAHCLAPAARRVLIAGNTLDGGDGPSGTHAKLDPLWSSRRMAVVHAGKDVRRIDKLRSIAAETLVRDHLRVCWRNFAPTGNCSRCAKCLLAMVILEECGQLVHSRVFEGRDQLVSRIVALRKTPDRYRSFEELARSPNLDSTLAAAVLEMARRSRHALRRDVRFRRAVIRWLLQRGRRSRR